MRKRNLLASLLLGLASLTGCETAEPTPTIIEMDVVEDGTTLFNHGVFRVEIPVWPEVESDEQQVLRAVSDGFLSVWIKRWDFIPDFVVEQIKQWESDRSGVALFDLVQDANGRRAELRLIESDGNVRMHTLLQYCAAETFEVTVAGPAGRQDDLERLAERVHRSVMCNQPPRPQHRLSGAVGMVIIPPFQQPGTFDTAAYQRSLAAVRDLGVQVSHYYFDWGEIETEYGTFDWSVPDYILRVHRLEGYEMSIAIKIIHTTTRGKMPSDVAHLPFDDPHFVARLSNFLVSFVDRYADQVHYLWIGNEVNDYFGLHRDEIDAYRVAFEHAREAIRIGHPDLPVGTIFAYHDAEKLGTLDIIPTLNRGDMVAFTLYLHQDFFFTQDPAEVGGYLDRMLAQAGDTPVAITETGWSTASEIGASEESQADYVQEVFGAFDQRRDRIRFLTWFILHDSLREDCAEQARTFLTPEIQMDDETMETFVIFLCHLGLRNADGTPKLGWEAWVAEMASLAARGER